MTSNTFNEFGKAVRDARTAKVWTLEMLAHEALGNQDRKSYVSRVERGKQPLSPLTIQKFATALDLPQAVVDRAKGVAPEGEDTPSQTDTDADRLYDELQGLRQQLKLSESLAIALAYEYAEGNPTDLETALRELKRAFEVAAEGRDRLPGNVDAAVNAVIAEVDRLNEEGSIEEAGAYLRDRLAASRDEAARAAQAHGRLIDKGIAQAVLERSVEDAVALELEKLTLNGAADGFQTLRDVQDNWYARGRDKGLAFDLEVAIRLAEASVDRARGPDKRGTALNDLGNALQILGARESGTARLEEAVAAYLTALEEFTRDRVPLHWARAQNNLANALLTLGERESGTALLEEAAAAFRAALEEYTRDRVRLGWAMTQNNLGNALSTLGERESGTARLEEAVAAYRAALEERTRERVPLDWAATQNNLGNALRILGERESGTARLDEAVEAYRAALEERTRERVPLDWASTQFNLANVARTFFDKTGNDLHLDAAEGHIMAAREVFAEAGASHFLGMADAQLARIAERRQAQ